MATTSSQETIFNVTPEELLEAITTPDFQVAQRLNDSAVIDAKFHEVSRSDDKLVFEVRSTEYERGLTGLNKKKSFESVTRTVWDLENKSSNWTYTSPQTDRATIKGAQRIEPAGENKAKLVAGFTIDVTVPFVGKKIEKAIADGMTKGRAKYDETLRQHLKKLS